MFCVYCLGVDFETHKVTICVVMPFGKNFKVHMSDTVKPAHVVTSIKKSHALKGRPF
jgi:hypothetical protein